MPCVPVGWARRRGLGLRPLGEQVFLDRTRHALAHEDSPRARLPGHVRLTTCATLGSWLTRSHFDPTRTPLARWKC